MQLEKFDPEPVGAQCGVDIVLDNAAHVVRVHRLRSIAPRIGPIIGAKRRPPALVQRDGPLVLPGHRDGTLATGMPQLHPDASAAHLATEVEDWCERGDLRIVP